MRQIFSSRPDNAAWRENCPAGWGHPALRGDKKSLCASNQTFPPHPARAAPPSPQGEGFSLRFIRFLSPNHLTIRFVYAKLIAYNQLYTIKGGLPYAYHHKK